MKKQQILLLIIVVLLAANGYWLWQAYRGDKTSEQRQTRSERLKNWMKRDLGFDDQQAEQYLVLRAYRDSLLVPANLELRAARMKLIQLINEPNAPDSVVQAVARQIGEKQQAVELVYLAHFKRLKAMCTPEQQPRLDSMLQRVVIRNTGGNPDSTRNNN